MSNKIRMRIKNRNTCVEVWLYGGDEFLLFLDSYSNDSAYCDSGNIKRAKRLYPNASIHKLIYNL